MNTTTTSRNTNTTNERELQKETRNGEIVLELNGEELILIPLRHEEWGGNIGRC